MFRITTVITDKVVLKLEGRLVGPWVDELMKTVCEANGWSQPLEVDVADLTFVDKDGEMALSWLHRRGARFQGKGLFSQYLFARLKIPLFLRQTVSDREDTETQR